MTEDLIIGWHHRLNGHEFEQSPGVGDGQGSLMCYSPWGHKESDMTERMNNDNRLSFPSLYSRVVPLKVRNDPPIPKSLCCA